MRIYYHCLFLGTIINYFSNVTEVYLNKQLPGVVDLSQLRAMALKMVDPIH